MPVDLEILLPEPRRITVADGDHAVGSAAGNDVRIEHPTVSRRHALLTVSGDSLVVHDLGSSNGTWLGSRRLSSPTRLYPPVTVSFGAVGATLRGIGRADAEAGLLFTDGGLETEHRAPELATTSTEPLGSWLAILPTIVGRVADGTSPPLLAREVGRHFERTLPRATVTIARTAPDSRAIGRAVGPTGVWVELPDPAARELFGPIVELAIELLALTQARPGRLPSDAAPSPPPLPEPETRVAALRDLYDRAARIARSDLAILVRGESGSGKDVLARWIHTASARADGPYVALNCAALPEHLLEAELFGVARGAATGVDERPGRLELANGGTLFLDEVGDMAASVQAKVLRALQDGTFYPVGGRDPVRTDVRLVSATNQPLEARMADGSFRTDLYFRIADWVAELPPLRHRRADVAPLAAHFVKREARQAGKRLTGISRGALDALLAYRWPGNIRQLAHAMKRAVLLTEPGRLVDTTVIEPEILAAVEEGATLAERLATAEAEIIADVLSEVGGDRSAAAERLGVSASTLYRRVRDLGL